MHIETINISLNAPSPLVAGLLAGLVDGARAASADARTAVSKPLAIGEVWKEQGGIYAGLSRGEDGQPDAHLILADVEPDGSLGWTEALAWAAGLKHAEHQDWHVPTRMESALLYANLKDHFDPAPWYWTSEQHSDDASYAWSQTFYDGYQLYGHKSFEGRVRAVRRLIL